MNTTTFRPIATTVKETTETAQTLDEIADSLAAKIVALGEQRRRSAATAWHLYGVSHLSGDNYRIESPAYLDRETGKVESATYEIDARTGECTCPDCQNRLRSAMVAGRYAFRDAGRNYRDCPKAYCKHLYIVAIHIERGTA